MIYRLIAAAALAAGLCSAVQAQAQQQWPGVTLYDQSGSPVGTATNPQAGANGVSAGAGGLSAFSRIPSSAASNNLTTAKAGPGRAYNFQGCNTTASTIYLRVYNAASTAAVTVGTTTPIAGPYAFPANNCVQPASFASDMGLYASAGITYAFGTAPTDADTTAITAGAIIAFQIGFQ